MPKRENALSPELQAEVFAVLIRSFRPFGSVADAQAFIGASERKRRAALSKAQADIIGKKSLYVVEANSFLEGWVAFYERFFPLELAACGGVESIRGVSLPEGKDDFGRLLVAIPGLTLNRVYDECAKHFKCWRHTTDLDKSVTVNDRSASNGAYAIWLRDRVEADEEYANLSANDVAARSLKGITLLERYLLELKFFSETRGHLDLENVTLCTGSRDVDGNVLGAFWGGGALRLRLRGPSYRYTGLRVREVLC